MHEQEPRRGGEDIEATWVALRGPNVSSTFDVPPHPDAVRAQQEAIRRHLRGGRPQDPPDAA